MERKGRGQLSSIEKLPEHAQHLVQDALAELTARDREQKEILADFNRKLARLDPPVAPISSSAFNRYSMRFALQARKLTEAREIAAAMAEKMDDMPPGDVGLLLGETVKGLINDVILNEMLSGESPSMAVLKAASESLAKLENGRLANARTAQIKARDFVTKAADAVEKAATDAGLTADTVENIKGSILGVGR